MDASAGSIPSQRPLLLNCFGAASFYPCDRTLHKPFPRLIRDVSWKECSRNMLSWSVRRAWVAPPCLFDEQGVYTSAWMYRGQLPQRIWAWWHRAMHLPLRRWVGHACLWEQACGIRGLALLRTEINTLFQVLRIGVLNGGKNLS